MLICGCWVLIWGKALDNTINIGNVVEVWEEIDVFREGLGQKQVKGKNYFYISNLNPHNIDITKSSFIANVSYICKCETIQDVTGHGSQDYSPVSLPGFTGCLGSTIGSHSKSTHSSPH